MTRSYQTDRPIIFSAPMVRALLDGRKSQTRRLLKPLPRRNIFFDPKTAGIYQFQDPPYAPGDRLYVREAMHWTDNLRFVADDSVVDFDRMPDGFTAVRAHVSGMFMFRWASRLTLTVTEVRVQRLQQISEADAMAEGWKSPEELGCQTWLPVGWYRDLWSSLHGPDAWDANPWVCAVSFTVRKGNIDEASHIRARATAALPGQPIMTRGRWGVT